MADGAAGLDTIDTTAQGKLKSLIERIERLEEDKAAVLMVSSAGEPSAMGWSSEIERSGGGP